jgi:hypothetical protein
VATLQQRLDVMKATLAQLQMQAGQVPAGDGGTMTKAVPAPVQVTVTATPMTTSAPSQMSTLGASDVTQIKAALGSLAAVLVSLQSQISAHPEMVASNGQGIVAALQSIGKTVVAIGTQMQGGKMGVTVPAASTPVSVAGSGIVAQATPQIAVTPSKTAPAVTAQAPVTVTPSPTSPSVVAKTDDAQQTAQAAASFSLGSLNWPLIIVILLIVVAIAVWLWWDDSSEVAPKQTVKTSPTAQQKPIVVQTMNQQVNNAQPRPQSSVQTPLSSAVSPQNR